MNDDLNDAILRIIADATDRFYLDVAGQLERLQEVLQQVNQEERIVADQGAVQEDVDEQEDGEEEDRSVGDEEEEEDLGGAVDEEEQMEDSDADSAGEDQVMDDSFEDDNDSDGLEQVAPNGNGVQNGEVEQYIKFTIYNIPRTVCFEPQGIKNFLSRLRINGCARADFQNVMSRHGMIHGGTVRVASFEAKGETARILSSWCRHGNYPMRMRATNNAVFGMNRDSHVQILEGAGPVIVGKCSFFRELARELYPSNREIVWCPESLQSSNRGRTRRINLTVALTEFSMQAVAAFRRLSSRVQGWLRRQARRQRLRVFEGVAG